MCTSYVFIRIHAHIDLHVSITTYFLVVTVFPLTVRVDTELLVMEPNELQTDKTKEKMIGELL